MSDLFKKKKKQALLNFSVEETKNWKWENELPGPEQAHTWVAVDVGVRLTQEPLKASIHVLLDPLPELALWRFIYLAAAFFHMCIISQ